MKNIIAIAIALSAASFAAPTFAGEGGGCHLHGNRPASETVVIDCATERRNALVKAGKLDKSWQKLHQDKVEQVDGKKGKEWKVTFKDPAAQDKSKQTLYMFFTLSGNFIAANFTGQ